jgi:trans-aconitate methyltransferase
VKIWDPGGYERNARFVSDLGAPLVDLLAPQPHESILDIGCGDGALTERIAAAGARVVGVDGSPAFVEAARARGIDARLADAQQLTFEREFDAAFSNAALHWMPDAEAVLAGVYRSLRPGGRFVGEMGAQGNVAAIATAMLAALEACGLPCPPFPWFFPTPDAYRALLERAGFTVDSIAAFARPTPLPTGLRAWLETFADPFFTRAPDADRGAVFARAERYLTPSLQLPDGSWVADYVRLRFAVWKPMAHT